jgi:hypothetical protein
VRRFHENVIFPRGVRAANATAIAGPNVHAWVRSRMRAEE